ncbi:hypothetical protein BJY27_003747 [Streptomyces rapamycinicus]|uniref:Uncharacterized protein n=1 Tax=Streptomyces rapamycinicus TaxID=1226757 RepID=A0ABR6LKD0_9ACTN|nr:hypothetical protein [Streptomyces rapamycinicus]
MATARTPAVEAVGPGRGQLTEARWGSYAP